MGRTRLVEEMAFTKARGWDPSGSRQQGSVGRREAGAHRPPTHWGPTPFAVLANATPLCPTFLGSSDLRGGLQFQGV